jgi:hypothetical protein
MRSGIRKKPIPDPGSIGQKCTGSRIRIRNTGPKAHGGAVLSPAKHTVELCSVPQSTQQCWAQGTQRCFAQLSPIIHHALVLKYRPVALINTSVADGIRCLFDLLDPGSGMGRKSRSGSEIRDEHPGSYFRELRNKFFRLTICKFLVLIRIRDPELSGSGIQNHFDPGSWIRNTDK